jgi:hypothetical protein
VALAIDASSPSANHSVNHTTAALTSNAFSPPSSTVIFVFWAGDDDTTAAGNPAAPTITDSLGSHLTWTRTDWSSPADSAGNGQAAIWWAVCASAQTNMTVTVTNGNTNATSGNDAHLRVVVFTGADTTQNGAHGKGGSTTQTGTATYTSTRAGSQGFLAFADWNASASHPTQQSGCTEDSWTTLAGDSTGWTSRETSTVGSSGSSVTVGCSAPTVEGRYAYVEVLPSVSASATYPPQRPATRRAVPLRVARTRQTVPVRAQVNPPIPVQETRQTRQLRGFLIRRGKLAQTVRPQVNPPFPFVEVAQPRRLRGMPVRRGHSWSPVPPQFNPPFPWAEIVQPRRLRGVLLRRGKLAAAPPQLDQLAPVQENAQPRRLRGFLLRRGKLAQTVPPQLNPPFPFAEVAQPRRLRGLLARRGKLAQPVQAQAAAAPPPYVPQALRSRVKAYRLFRGHQAQVVPVQQAAPAGPAFVPDRTRPRLRLSLLRRGRDAQPVPAQDIPLQARTVRRPCPVHGRPRMPVPLPAQAAPVPVKQARRPLLAALRRGAKALLPLKQAVPPASPPFVPSPGRRRLAFLPLARRGHVVAPPVCSCHTARPSTGTTGRPSTGTTAYATATTARPSTGTTARPSTGTTKDPCC